MLQLSGGHVGPRGETDSDTAHHTKNTPCNPCSQPNLQVRPSFCVDLKQSVVKFARPLILEPGGVNQVLETCLPTKTVQKQVENCLIVAMLNKRRTFRVRRWII